MYELLMSYALIVGFPIVIVNQLPYSSKLLGIAEGGLGGAIVLSSLVLSMMKSMTALKSLCYYKLYHY